MIQRCTSNGRLRYSLRSLLALVFLAAMLLIVYVVLYKPLHGGYRLINATKRGDIKAVDNLIAQAASVNVQDKYKTTALMYSAQRGHTKIAERLIEAGASVDLHEIERGSALMYAAGGGHLDIV